MNCMKCGRDLKEDGVFCDICLEEMEREPVKINTSVLIPTQPPKKATPHHRPTVLLEEELARMQKANQNLILALVLSVVAAMLFGIMAYSEQLKDAVEDVGRNFSVVETILETEP